MASSAGQRPEEEALEPADAMARYRVELCRELVADMARYDAQMKASKQRIRAAVTASATSLAQIYGCGPICAAMIIGHSGDIVRFKSRSHYASYNATAPIQASSGSKQRHRLNPRGNRQLNWAIHMIAVTQLRNPTTSGRAYFDRKVAEGKTNNRLDILIRRLFGQVTPEPDHHATTSTPLPPEGPTARARTTTETTP
jgi:transposase